MDFHMKQSSESSALPLFTPEPTSSNKLSCTNLSVNSTTSAPTRSFRMGGSCYFSMAQWQELEVQALIFRHMLAGAAIPPELLHLVKKSLILNSHSTPYYLPHYSHYEPALLQSGYWGRGAMDPEPGRCRRTDGKKWRCSRDVVGGHKYCERHMHRGRNRSRKPVEIPTPTTGVSALANKNNNGVGVLIKTSTNQPIAAQPLTAVNGGNGDGTNFGLSGNSHSFDLLQLNPRPSESMTETKGLFRPQNELSEDDKSGGRILRHFFDDWPRSVQESENTINNASPGTSLSISVPGNQSSDFSLKLSTGGEPGPEEGNVVREHRAQLNWASASAWSTNQMGGPLAEALRSSTTSTSSPTSVLHQLRGETSFIST